MIKLKTTSFDIVSKTFLRIFCETGTSDLLLKLLMHKSSLHRVVSVKVYISTEIVSNLQQGSGKKTRLKSFFTSNCTMRDAQQDKGRHQGAYR